MPQRDLTNGRALFVSVVEWRSGDAGPGYRSEHQPIALLLRQLPMSCCIASQLALQVGHVLQPPVGRVGGCLRRVHAVGWAPGAGVAG
jgi:hypothetical protein